MAGAEEGGSHYTAVYACGLRTIIKVRGWGSCRCPWTGAEEGSGMYRGEGVEMLAVVAEEDGNHYQGGWVARG